MNNLNVDKIRAVTQIDKLEKEEQEINKKLEKLENDIKKIKRNCSHEVIIEVDHSENLGGYSSSDYLVCLFCGETFSDTRYINTKGNGLSLINIKKFGDLFFLSDEEKINEARNRYIDVCKNHIKKMSASEVASEVQKSLDEDYQKYRRF